MTNPEPYTRPWKGLHYSTLDAAGIEIGDNGIITVPSRGRDGSTIREHYFSSDGRRAWWGQGEGLCLYGLETIPSNEVAARSSLLLCEGETDVLAAREWFDPDAYTMLGLPGASTWKPEWSLVADGFQAVYVIPDGDDAGRGMAKAILADIPWGQYVRLPENMDVRDVLRTGGGNALADLLDQADHDARLLAAFKIATTVEELELLLAPREMTQDAA